MVCQHLGVEYQEVGSHLPDMGPVASGYSRRLLAPSGGHQNMYGWQVGGPYPTGMLYCVN